MAPDLIFEDVERSADPPGVGRFFERLGSERSGAAERLTDDGLRAALIAVAGASPWLSRICITDPAALDVLSELDRPTPIDSVSGPGGRDLARVKRLEILRIAARDLLNLDRLEDTGLALSELSARLLERAYRLTEESSAGVAIIGMGKLGASELNYASDIDVVVVSPSEAGLRVPAGVDVRPFLALARTTWRVDLDLRPEGRSGSLARTIESFRAYWDRWAETWEFQALLKARAVAGEPGLGALFESEAARRVWDREFGADDLREVRSMKARAEQQVVRRGLDDRELKLGRGGIRDIEFAVQLLQLVHGRADPALRVRPTLSALATLAEGGYIGVTDADALEQAYRFLRRVEHRLQLREDEQTHTVPAARVAREHLARVLGYRDGATTTAAAQFDGELRTHQATVRAIHERLFFRPLMEAFASAPTRLSLRPEAVTARLAAFGFADAARTHQAVAELTRGLSRSSKLMQQSLPLLLDWLSSSPDPDLGLLGLRTLAGERHSRDLLTAVCRESPRAARQLCLLLGTGPRFARDLRRHPDLLRELAAGTFFDRPTREGLAERLERSVAWRSGEGAVETGLQSFARAESLRIAGRNVLGMDDSETTTDALSDLAETVIAAAVRHVGPSIPFSVMAMGHLGGREMAFGSDLDLLFVYDQPDQPGPADGWGAADPAAVADAGATAVIRAIGGSTPATGIYRVDTALRPEGRQGPQARSFEAYAAYYGRWAQVWERQALIRGRFVAGDTDLGQRFAEMASEFVWGRPLTAAELTEIRRTKARMERERVPAGEDPKFHLKLGPGSLSDIEWTVQLLQLQHGIPSEGTATAIRALQEGGLLAPEDARVLLDAYRFCEQTRNRLRLVRDTSADSLPGPGPVLTVLARSLGRSAPGLRNDYQHHTRRARRVVERLFYGRPSS